ncbi:MAG: amidase family protein [Burkholderiaceae bacterium]
MKRVVVALLIAASCAASIADTTGPAPRAAAPNTERLRALDWTPFETALARFPADRAAAIDRLMARATVTELRAAMTSGTVSAEAVTLYFLSRIKQHDTRLRTYLELNPRALDEARASDARRQAGASRGPFDGIPVSLKDNIETAAPMHTTAGAEILLRHIAPQDAPLVAQLRAHGAVILGKANLSEFAGLVSFGRLTGGFSAVGGQTVNPHGHYPSSGSSSGSAAGVAAVLAMVSVGTETSGSVIGPSAWNGVVGMKPSRGRVNGAGVVPLVLANDSPGPIGRSVTDVAALLDAIDTASVDYVAGLRADALHGATVGLLPSDSAAAPVDAPVLEAARASLVALGARLRPASVVGMPAWGTDLSFLVYLSAGMRHDMMAYVAARSRGVTTLEDLIAYNAADAKRRIPTGQLLLQQLAPMSAGISAADYVTLSARMRQAATEMLETTFRTTGADVLVSIETQYSPVYATAGFPTITVPFGLRTTGRVLQPSGVSSLGMPVGITFIGKAGEDARVLAFAYAFEQATKRRVRPDLR